MDERTVAAELLRGVRLNRRLLAPAIVVVAAAVASNGVFLHDAYKSYLRSTEIVRAAPAGFALVAGAEVRFGGDR